MKLATTGAFSHRLGIDDAVFGNVQFDFPVARREFPLKWVN
jgi:hypothetical protein